MVLTSSEQWCMLTDEIKYLITLIQSGGGTEDL